MSAHTAQTDSSIAVSDGRSRPRYTKEDALSDREYQLLLEGASRMNDYEGQQARFAILVMGRLGLRRGELAHLREEWVDWHRSMICIPRFEPCTKGRDGGPCGSCKLKAQQEADHNADVTYEAALARRWHPKTINAAREVPWDFDTRVELVVERFLGDDRYDGWPLSANTINRRIKTAAELAEEIDETAIYPHALRATAASHHADRGLDVYALKALMGWADLATAQHYIASSGERTARSLHMIHSQ